MKAKITLAVGLAIAVSLVSAAREAPAPGQEGKPDPTLTLKIGNPKLSVKTMAVERKGVHSAETGGTVPFDRMIREMESSRFVYVGETHNSMPMHDIQLRVLKSLYERDRHLAVGLEMFPVTVQEALNKWSAGMLTKDEFIREARWYVHWSFNFGFYEKIFDFVKRHRLPVYALNVPRDIITKIRMRGWKALSPAEKEFIPIEPDLSNEDHRTLIRTIFENMDMPPQMKGPGLDKVFQGLYRSQAAWDEVMGANADSGFKREGRRMIVFAGSGHLIYNLGLNRRAFEKNGMPYKTVVSLVVPDDRRTVPVARSYADYVIGLEEERRPAFPSVGLGLKKVENMDNPIVESTPIRGPAARAGFDKGDIILSVDGTFFSDINELRIYLARFKYGDRVQFRILRDGGIQDITLEFNEEPSESGRELTVSGV